MASRAKQTLTPKAIIHQKFGANASYRVEEVHDSSHTTCPGLAIPQKGPSLYRCHLQLPDFSVVSNVFKKKKDSEQSAAELALEKLGIRPRDDDITVDQAWDDIVGRIKYIFSDEFLSAEHPLGCHLRAALRRDGDCRGSVPASVVATFDAKINSRCKIINPSAELDPFLVVSYVMEAAAKLPDYIVVSPHEASLRRKNPYPSAVIEALAAHVSSPVETIDAVHIPCIGKEIVEADALDISSDTYYLDVIAERLGLKDGNQLMISRTFGKASCGSECRLYSAIPKLKSSDNLSEVAGSSNEESSHIEKTKNARASYICGQDIHSDAILASFGYRWKSNDLVYENVTVKSFYRICVGMSPNGIYKISRQSMIAARLPFSFTTRSNWRGPLPREILCMFCHQHRLAEPVFTVSADPVKPLSEIFRSHKKLKVSGSDDADNENLSKGKDDTPGFRCGVKVLTKSQDLVLDCSPRKFYEKENDAIQNASLKALLWFSKFSDELDLDGEHPGDTDDDQDIKSSTTIVFPVPPILGNGDNSRTTDVPSGEKPVQSITNGSVVSICYSMSLEVDPEFSSDGESSREVTEGNNDVESEEDVEASIDLIESNEEIEFEVGTGAMNPHIEKAVTQMTVGEYASFNTSLPDAAQALILATANDTERMCDLLSERSQLVYSILLLGVKGPTEERMEAAFFKPPLSKQRVEYALKHIRESSASTLADFGCGSGSLLDSLLDYPTSLQTIIGVDISPKGLARAAKMLHAKLNKEACNLESAILYDGSILEFDSRLHDIDIGTCLEVIEHMEEDQACQFGEIVLSVFLPKLLIVSTPNFEYNTILQRSTPESQEDKSQSQLPKFRNHDHKFEWTREQFNNWASNLAERHNYSVKFSGVGGSGEVEPGFASQIAVFKRGASSEDKVVAEGSMQQPYKVIWEWKKGNEDKKD